MEDSLWSHRVERRRRGNRITQSLRLIAVLESLQVCGNWIEYVERNVQGQDTSRQYRFTDTRVKGNGKWQCVASQATKVQP